MIRLCILGNSHVASLRQGWDLLKQDWPEIMVDFFAEAGNEGLGSVVVQNGQLTSESPHARRFFMMTHGKECLNIAEYDAFLIHGARSRTFFPDGKFYSAACMDAMIDDLTRGTPAQLVLTAVRQVTDAPIYVGHTPLLAAKEVANRSVAKEYQAGIDFLNHRHYQKFAAAFVGQPTETIVNGRSTAPEFSWGVKKMSAVLGVDDATSDRSDNTHMDAAFGAVWLKSFFTEHLVLVDSKRDILKKRRDTQPGPEGGGMGGQVPARGPAVRGLWPFRMRKAAK